MFLKNQYPGTVVTIDGVTLRHNDVAAFPDDRKQSAFFNAAVKAYRLRETDGPATVDINGPLPQSFPAPVADLPVEGDQPAPAAKVRKGRAKK